MKTKSVYLESLNVVDLTDLLHRTLGRSIMLWWQAAWHYPSMLFILKDKVRQVSRMNNFVDHL